MTAQPLPRASTDGTSPTGRRAWWFILGWVVIVTIFAVGCWIRFIIAMGDLLWLDELHTAWVVNGSFRQMLTRSAQGNQAPLYFGLEWLTVQCLGTSELTLRLVSLLAGALSMAIAARFVWKYTGSIAASAITMALIAVDYSFIRYSTEARPYALLHLTSLIQAVFLWQMVDHWRPSPPGGQEFSSCVNHCRFGIFWLVLSSWLVVYTHYTGVFLLATEFLFLLVVLIFWWLTRGLAKGTLKQVVGTLVLFAIGCLPLLFQMNQAFGKPADWSSVAKLADFLSQQKGNGINWFGIPLVAVLFSVGVFSIFRLKTSAVNQPDRWHQVRWLIWIAIWFVGPLGIIVTLHALADIPIALSRYLSVALIAGPIFAGGIVGSCRVPDQWLTILIVVLASVFMHVRNESLVVEIVREGQLPLLRKENWKAAIEVVNENPGRVKWPLFLFGAVIEDEGALSNFDAEFQAYLQFPVRGLYELDSSQRVVFAGPTMSRQHFDERYLDEVVEQGGAWILVRHRSAITAEITNQLINMLQERLSDRSATLETNWFGSQNNDVQLISIEIKQ